MPTALEISIPTTTLSADAKPHTLYNVSLRLPLRSFTLQKRYNEFLTLHNTLVSQSGQSPPCSIPGKTWFRSTIKDEDLLEERRKGLETYLRAINGAEDPRWRVTSAWRSFLNLPSSFANATAAAGSPSGAVEAAAHALGDTKPITDPTIWLDTHRTLKTVLHDARLQLTKRDQATTAQAQHEASAKAKSQLIRAGTLIQSLDTGLSTLSGGGRTGGAGLGEGEVRRRRDLLTAARKEKEGLEGVLNAWNGRRELGGTGSASATAGEKAELIGNGSTTNITTSSSSSHAPASRPGGRVLGGTAKETTQTRELDNEGVLQLQKQIMAEQDSDVIDLTKVVRRMKEMGVQINDELQLQKEMLDRMDEDVDRVGGKINVAKKRIGKIR